jgi:nitroreductase
MDVMTAILGRRSIRKYKSKPVEEEKIRLVLEAARYAPSAGNTQPWDFIVVTDPQIKTRVGELFQSGHHKLYTEVVDEPLVGRELEERMRDRRTGIYEKVPVYIIVCLNRKQRRFSRDPEAEKQFEQQSVAAAIENLILAAYSLGLGTCWMGAPVLKEAGIKQLLAIPEGVRVVAGIPLGYADESPPPRPRYELKEVVHRERW